MLVPPLMVSVPVPPLLPPMRSFPTTVNVPPDRVMLPTPTSPSAMLFDTTNCPFANFTVPVDPATFPAVSVPPTQAVPPLVKESVGLEPLVVPTQRLLVVNHVAPARMFMSSAPVEELMVESEFVTDISTETEIDELFVKSVAFAVVGTVPALQLAALVKLPPPVTFQ